MHWAGFVVMGASTYLPRCTSAETTPAKATAAAASDGGAGADSAKDGKTGKEWLREKLQEAKELFEEELTHPGAIDSRIMAASVSPCSPL